MSQKETKTGKYARMTDADFEFGFLIKPTTARLGRQRGIRRHACVG